MRTDRKIRNKEFIKKGLGVLCTLFSFVLCSCLKNDVYSEYKSLKDMAWGSKDTLVFATSFQDTIQAYSVEILIRKDVKYPYKDLWMEVAVLQDSIQYECDTLHIFLSDKNGRALGKGFGTLYQKSDTLSMRFVPLNSHPYFLKVRHLMTGDYLYGISDIGIRVSKR